MKKTFITVLTLAVLMPTVSFAKTVEYQGKQYSEEELKSHLLVVIKKILIAQIVELRGGATNATDTDMTNITKDGVSFSYPKTFDDIDFKVRTTDTSMVLDGAESDGVAFVRTTAREGLGLAKPLYSEVYTDIREAAKKNPHLTVSEDVTDKNNVEVAHLVVKSNKNSKDAIGIALLKTKNDAYSYYMFAAYEIGDADDNEDLRELVENADIDVSLSSLTEAETLFTALRTSIK